MEDNNNNETKISLATFLKVLLLFVIIIAAILCFTVYNIISFRKELSEALQDSTTQVSEINNDKQEIQNKIEKIDDAIENITNTISENVIEDEKEETLPVVEDTPKKFTEKDIKDNLQKTLNIDGSLACGPQAALYHLGFYTEETHGSYYNDEKPSKNHTGFMITEVKFEDFYKEIRKYMSDECFEKHFGKYFIDEDGYLAYDNIGASGIVYTVQNIKKVNADNKYTADVRFVTEGYDEIQQVDFSVKSTNGIIDTYEFIYEDIEN